MPQTGTIQFRVYTSSANLPIQGATVLVRRQQPPYEVLSIMMTDSSGQTPVLSLAAPDPSLGQNAGSSIRPWMGLKVWIEYPAYESIILDGVQLFPGVRTVQTVQMLPNGRESSPEEVQEYSFTPQPIWDGEHYE